jgi:predicted ATPase
MASLPKMESLVMALKTLQDGPTPRETLPLLFRSRAVPSTARSTNERWLKAELLRLLVGAGLQAGSLDPDEAAERLVEATRFATVQGAKLFEQRAATDLLSLWREDPRRDNAYTRLVAVYSQFTNGFDLPDLKKAQSLLGRACSFRWGFRRSLLNIAFTWSLTAC